MKIRLAPVTNSSSASFILTINSIYEDKDKFVRLLSERLNSYLEESTLSFNSNETIEDIKERARERLEACKNSGSLFVFEDWTAMLNDLEDDLPKWMQHLILIHAQGKGLEYGIKDLILKVESE